jgi:diguanylate cyclase (GGDEF)-like protein
MSLDIGETTSYEALRMQAVTQLAAISMDAEMSRAEAARQAELTREQLAQVSDQAEALSKHAQALSVQANTDALTKVANRHAFEVYLDQTIKRAGTTGSGVGLIMLDLDHFKRLNDTFGHQAGDRTLQMVGRCLSKISRGSTFAARYGGEEFVVVVRDADAEKVVQLADGLRAIIERLTFNHGGEQVTVTASFGTAYASLARERVDAAGLIARADEALYQAKRSGRNRVESHP